MPACDAFQRAVKNGLIKDGGTITADPLLIAIGPLNVHVDLGAARPVAAERANERIAVEVERLLGPSLATDFHPALGQLRNTGTPRRPRTPDGPSTSPSLGRPTMISSGISLSSRPGETAASGRSRTTPRRRP